MTSTAFANTDAPIGLLTSIVLADATLYHPNSGPSVFFTVAFSCRLD